MYRVTDENGQALVVKHAPPYAKSLGETFQLSQRESLLVASRRSDAMLMMQKERERERAIDIFALIRSAYFDLCVVAPQISN